MDTVLAPGESGVHFRIETETRSLSFVQEGSDAVTKKKKGRMQIQTTVFFLVVHEQYVITITSIMFVCTFVLFLLVFARV